MKAIALALLGLASAAPLARFNDIQDQQGLNDGVSGTSNGLSDDSLNELLSGRSTDNGLSQMLASNNMQGGAVPGAGTGDINSLLQGSNNMGALQGNNGDLSSMLQQGGNAGGAGDLSQLLGKSGAGGNTDIASLLGQQSGTGDISSLLSGSNAGAGNMNANQLLGQNNLGGMNNLAGAIGRTGQQDQTQTQSNDAASSLSPLAERLISKSNSETGSDPAGRSQTPSVDNGDNASASSSVGTGNAQTIEINGQKLNVTPGQTISVNLGQGSE
jgi:hypothetical protein